MFLLLFLIGFLAYLNARLAKKKGKNPVLWAVLSIVGFFMSYSILGAIYVSAIYDGPLSQDAVMIYLKNSPLVVAMMLMLGIGGMLLVRFILERSKGGEPV